MATLLALGKAHDCPLEQAYDYPNMMTSSKPNMMTSSNGNIFRVTGHLCAQRPVTRSFDVFFDLRPNKRLSKQSWGWWFETPSRPLWRHRNGKWINGSHGFTNNWWYYHKLNDAYQYLSSYPGYFREPHWKSMGLPAISRVTWQVCRIITVSMFYGISHISSSTRRVHNKHGFSWKKIAS